MRAANPSFVGIFVEGPSDVEMWRPWVRHRPIPCDGAPGVRSAIASVRKQKIIGCVGIVDADLDHVRHSLVPDPDLVVSEYHDHECDLVCSPTLEAFVERLPHAATELSNLIAPDRDFRTALLKRALPFGLLRWLYFDRKMQFPPQITPANSLLFDRKAWCLNRDKLLEVAAKDLRVSSADIENEITQRSTLTKMQWLICNGHDVITLIRLAISVIGDASKCGRSDESVAWGLRSAVDSAHLHCLSMWQQLGDWESRNKPFVARKPVAIESSLGAA